MKRKHSTTRYHQLSVRRVSSELSKRLDTVRRKRKLSLNQTVLDLLSEAVGLESPSWVQRYTGAGDAEHRQLSRALQRMRTVDPRDWA